MLKWLMIARTTEGMILVIRNGGGNLMLVIFLGLYLYNAFLKIRLLRVRFGMCSAFYLFGASSVYD